MGVETKRALENQQDKVGLGCISCPGRGRAARTVCPAWDPRQRPPRVGRALQLAGQPHLSKDVTGSVAVTVPGVRLKRSLCRGSDSGVEEGMLNTVTDKLYMQVSLTLSTLILNL